MVGADEADQDTDQLTPGVLDDPRRPREVLEPLPEEERMEASTAFMMGDKSTSSLSSTGVSNVSQTTEHFATEE